MQWFKKNTERRIYLDYASATPVADSVRAAMEPYWSEEFGNPSGIHKEGKRAHDALTKARSSVANLIHAQPDEIVFTGGGTESNNIAIIGVCEALVKEGRVYSDMHVITTAIEHPAVGECVTELKRRGVSVSIIPVSEEGLLDMEAFQEALSPKTVLVSVGLVNSEIGVVQDMKQIARMVRRYKKEENVERLYIHTDASQAPLYLKLHVESLGVDLLTLDAAKMYGPKGVGALYVRRKVKITNVLYGGSQEEGLRPGTENTPLVVGFGKAAEEAQERQETETVLIENLRDKGITLLLENIPKAELNGSSSERIANNIHISVPGIDGEFAVVTLDEAGVAASTRSACLGADGEGSHVIREIGKSEAHAKGSIRLTLGKKTTESDLVYVTDVLREHVTKMQEANERFDLS